MQDEDCKSTQRRTIPRWSKGMFVGQLVWTILALELRFQVLQKIERHLPKWFDKFDVIDAPDTLLAVLAAPVTLGGWLFVWGDNGPPYPWIEGWTFIITFGLCFYGVLGAALAQFGPAVASRITYRFSLRTLLIAMSLVAVVLGLAVWMVR